MNNMKKKIAIRGHRDKGAEVIKILERLGGFNRDSVKGTDIDSIYFINNEFEIDRIEYCTQHNTLYQIYTLEEYLESLNQTEQKNDKIQRQLSVDIETAKQWYKSNNVVLEQIALSLFTEEELTKVELPTSWEEFCEKYDKINNEWYINSVSVISPLKNEVRGLFEDKNLLETPEDAEAILALIQLKRLRDDWWKILDYQPNRSDDTNKCYVSILEDDNIIPVTTSWANQFLVFPTYGYCEQFIDCFKDLIRKAKPFLS